jgi:leucyl/phenylalanyl-tRNA--protein transferase
MSRGTTEPETITPEVLLRAYSIGIFPMAEHADDPSLHWIEPHRRGIIPLDSLKISSSLAKTLRSNRFEIRVDHDFNAIISACADRPGDTWINERIRILYGTLFKDGDVHTVEVYSESALVGGIYGVSIGSAFFGESMFHRKSDASKVALMHLAARLIAGGYALFDTQFLTPHLASLGGVEITRSVYKSKLYPAVLQRGNFAALDTATHARGRDILEILIGSRRKD